MTVYVDDFRTPATVGGIRGRWSHLGSDNPDVEELHRFAEGIGLRRAWFQEYTKTGHLYRPHYDVTDSLRRKALSAGAQPISWMEFPDVLRRAREVASRFGGDGDGEPAED